ncbi:hypothetical protein BLNAU_1058 [Blattamonas nauphoetae]|uniref:Uncharacterized protein n=1 Tax=Blattamonas nauphoetae TaxID=2049346 RepID=A0ABQ9YJN5_9EUKA|nr:hypothetical protein BLNAU_1058 [Blattamonas nauphoetae]
MFDLQENRSNPNVKQVVHALSEEGMEDRSDISRDTFSFVFLNKWKGANVRAIFERIGADHFFARLHRPQGPAPFYRSLISHHSIVIALSHFSTITGQRLVTFSIFLFHNPSFLVSHHSIVIALSHFSTITGQRLVNFSIIPFPNPSCLISHHSIVIALSDFLTITGQRFGDGIPPYDDEPFVDDRLAIDDSDDISLLTDDSVDQLEFTESEDDLPFEFNDMEPPFHPEMDEQPAPTNPEQTTPGGTSGEHSSS